MCGDIILVKQTENAVLGPKTQRNFDSSIGNAI